MNFKKIEFKDANAQRVYDNYIDSIRNTVKAIGEKDRQEVLMEFNSHIYEFLQSHTSEPELDSLLDVIKKLGMPEEVLKPLIADKLLEKATRTFNPLHVFKALLFNLTNGFSYIVFSILYLILGSFVFLIIAKIFYPHVGLYFKEGEFRALGVIKDDTAYQEILGHWFIPIILLAIVVVYLLLTFLLKLRKSLIKK